MYRQFFVQLLRIIIQSYNIMQNTPLQLTINKNIEVINGKLDYVSTILTLVEQVKSGQITEDKYEEIHP